MRILISKGLLPFKGTRLSKVLQSGFMIAKGGLILHSTLIHILIGR